MAVRDLGYRPYEGERLPATHNNWVMLRHALRRAWGSWLVKIAAFLGVLPVLGFAGFHMIGLYMMSQMGAPQEQTVTASARLVPVLISVQFWFFLTTITVGAGAGAIAEDITFKAFSFYFSKPVTPPQYLAGRIGAVAIWCFAMTFVPAAGLVLVYTGSAPEEMRLEEAGYMLPTLLYCLLMSVVLSTTSVGLSSLSGSRALTMSTWLAFLVLPYILAGLVNTVADWPWLHLTSIYGLLDTVGEALFKVETDSQLKWWHAAPVLAAYTAGGVALAWRRVRSAEVIA